MWEEVQGDNIPHTSSRSNVIATGYLLVFTHSITSESSSKYRYTAHT